MRFQVGERTFEIGTGHEVLSCFMTFDEHGYTASASLTGKHGQWAVFSDGTVVGKMPVGVYDITGLLL
jgi:hypothetical protein